MFQPPFRRGRSLSLPLRPGAACSLPRSSRARALDGSRPCCAGSRAVASAASAATCAPGRAAGRGPARSSPTAPPAPAPAPSPVTPSAPPSVAQEPPPPPASAPLAEAPLPHAPAGREAPEAQGEYAPKSLAQLVGTWAYYAEDCERLFERRGGGWAYRQPVDKFARPRSSSRKGCFAFRHLPGRGRV